MDHDSAVDARYTVLPASVNINNFITDTSIFIKRKHLRFNVQRFKLSKVPNRVIIPACSSRIRIA